MADQEKVFVYDPEILIAVEEITGCEGNEVLQRLELLGFKVTSDNAANDEMMRQMTMEAAAGISPVWEAATGMKAELVAKGWSIEVAETMVAAWALSVVGMYSTALQQAVLDEGGGSDDD